MTLTIMTPNSNPSTNVLFAQGVRLLAQLLVAATCLVFSACSRDAQDNSAFTPAPGLNQIPPEAFGFLQIQVPEGVQRRGSSFYSALKLGGSGAAVSLAAIIDAALNWSTSPSDPAKAADPNIQSLVIYIAPGGEDSNQAFEIGLIAGGRPSRSLRKEFPALVAELEQRGFKPSEEQISGTSTVALSLPSPLNRQNYLAANERALALAATPRKAVQLLELHPMGGYEKITASLNFKKASAMLPASTARRAFGYLDLQAALRWAITHNPSAFSTTIGLPVVPAQVRSAALIFQSRQVHGSRHEFALTFEAENAAQSQFLANLKIKNKNLRSIWHNQADAFVSMDGGLVEEIHRANDNASQPLPVFFLEYFASLGSIDQISAAMWLPEVGPVSYTHLTLPTIYSV